MSEGEKYIDYTFKPLQWPNYFLYNAKRKAYKTYRIKIEKSTDNNNPTSLKKLGI